MRALLVEELLPDFGGCRLADGLAKPAPRAGEVQVKIRAGYRDFVFYSKRVLDLEIVVIHRINQNSVTSVIF